MQRERHASRRHHQAQTKAKLAHTYWEERKTLGDPPDSTDLAPLDRLKQAVINSNACDMNAKNNKQYRQAECKSIH